MADAKLLAHVAGYDAKLHNAMVAAGAAKGDPEALGKIFDGAMIQWLLDYIKAHPDQITALILWLLQIFGVPVPPIPLAE